MNRKYWVPAIERAHKVLMVIANTPRQLKLMEISERTEINKSSLFSILNTMQSLGWIQKEIDNTYSIGSALGFLSAKYAKQFDMIDIFNYEAKETLNTVKETIQLAILEGKDIIYIAKKEWPSLVRVVTDPGTRMPAHATALGKVLLSKYTEIQIKKKYYNQCFRKVTEHTVDNVDDLLEQIKQLDERGYIIEREEAVEGFLCIASPIKNEHDEIIAAVSFTMSIESWKRKKELCKKEILSLANRLSLKTVTT